MKRFYFNWIWQWINDDFIGFNPIGIEFEYDKLDPSMTIMVVLLGAGFSITMVCPWETKESTYAKECAKSFITFFSDVANVSKKETTEEKNA